MRRSFGVHDELKKELANLDKALSSGFARSCRGAGFLPGALLRLRP
jgi:hypothetical protein